jgi:lysyl-tRNA synthetase class 2
MASLEELRNERIKKLEHFESLVGSAFPSTVVLPGREISSREAKEMLHEVEASDEVVYVRGRLHTLRGQGKILFGDLYDETGKLQCVLKVDVLGEDAMKLFSDTADIGDFFAFSGKLFITARGEKSLEVHEYQLLTKSLLPLPSAWYGLENEEEAIRKRYNDFVMNPEKRDLFYKKAKFWQVVRRFMSDRGFLEVETPTIETTTGGAEARPFKTYHNDFDMDVYMRICVGELWQKRLLAAGFEKTFEIGKAYRNEGSSPMHLQEFTNCEFYWAYANYRDGMSLIKDLYRTIAREVFGTTAFDVFGYKFDLADEWEEIEYVGEIEKL